MKTPSFLFSTPALHISRKYLTLATEFFLDGENRKAFYVMVYFALCTEMSARGPESLIEIFRRVKTFKSVCRYCVIVDTIIEANSRSKLIELIRTRFAE